MRTISIETPVGVALAHLSPVDTPRGALVLGHGAGGGIGAPDLVAVSGDPLTNVRLLEAPDAVVKGGVLVKPVAPPRPAAALAPAAAGGDWETF